jgi:hypothetical protein
MDLRRTEGSRGYCGDVQRVVLSNQVPSASSKQKNDRRKHLMTCQLFFAILISAKTK